MADWGSALGGAGTGAIYGAQFGGPVGGAIGGAIGGIAGLFGGKRKAKKLSTFDPQQQGLYDQYMQSLQGKGGPLGDLYGQFNPEETRDVFNQQFAQPAYQKFNEEIVPSITGQFRGKNLQNSSYLGGALAREGRNVQNNLNGNLSQMLSQAREAQNSRRQQGVQNSLGMNSFDYSKQQPSIFDNLMGSLSQGAGQLLSTKFGGSSGANQLLANSQGG